MRDEMSLEQQRDEINDALLIDLDDEYALMEMEWENDEAGEIVFDNSEIAEVERGNTVTGAVVA